MRPKLILRFVFILIAVLITGCVPSWNALFTEKDLVFDAKLVGTWNGDDGEVWTFAKDGEKNYKLVYEEKEGRKAVFIAHLVKLQDRQFLDIFLDETANEHLKLNTLAWLTMPQAHLFFRVDEIGSSLKMAVIDPEWLRKHLEKEPKALAHLERQNGALITAETKDLQAFVLKHAAGQALFGEAFALKRKTGT
jgi:hypothetical protein